MLGKITPACHFPPALGERVEKWDNAYELCDRDVQVRLPFHLSVGYIHHGIPQTSVITNDATSSDLAAAQSSCSRQSTAKKLDTTMDSYYM